MIGVTDFDIRYSELTDLSFLKKWFEEEGSLDPFPFGLKEKEDSLKNWIGFSKFKASLTGTIQNEPCAIGTLFLMPYKKVAHLCSFYLIVDPAHRKKGVGTSMVRNLLHLAKTRFRLDGVYVEIYEPNPLFSILEKERFTEIFRQKNYAKIKDKKHDRIVLEHFFV